MELVLIEIYMVLKFETTERNVSMWGRRFWCI